MCCLAKVDSNFVGASAAIAATQFVAGDTPGRSKLAVGKVLVAHSAARAEHVYLPQTVHIILNERWICHLDPTASLLPQPTWVRAVSLENRAKGGKEDLSADLLPPRQPRLALYPSLENIRRIVPFQGQVLVCLAKGPTVGRRDQHEIRQSVRADTGGKNGRERNRRGHRDVQHPRRLYKFVSAAVPSVSQ